MRHDIVTVLRNAAPRLNEGGYTGDTSNPASVLAFVRRTKGFESLRRVLSAGMNGTVDDTVNALLSLGRKSLAMQVSVDEAYARRDDPLSTTRVVSTHEDVEKPCTVVRHVPMMGMRQRRACAALADYLFRNGRSRRDNDVSLARVGRLAEEACTK